MSWFLTGLRRLHGPPPTPRRERLEIRDGRWRLQQQLALAGAGGAPDWSSAGGLGRKEVGGEVRNLGGAVIRTVAIVNGEPQTQLELTEGERRGQGALLIEAEGKGLPSPLPGA